MFCAFVAQGTEHRSPKAGVGRSNRPGGAIFCWRYQVQCCCSVHFHGCCRCFVRVVSFRSRCCRGFFSFTLLPRSFPFPLVQFCVTFRRRCAYCFAPPSTSRPLRTRIAFGPLPARSVPPRECARFCSPKTVSPCAISRIKRFLMRAWKIKTNLKICVFNLTHTPPSL